MLIRKSSPMSGSAMSEVTEAVTAEGSSTYIQKALGLTLLFVLVAGCLTVLRPFIVAILWAAILVVATWPLYERLAGWVGGRRSLAAGLMTLSLTAVLLLPLVLLGARLTENVVQLAETASVATEKGVPPPPAWVQDVPLVGSRLDASWRAAAQDASSLGDRLHEYVGPARDWLLARGADVLEGLAQLTLSLLTSFFLYRDGPTIRRSADAIISRISGAPPRRFSEAAGSTITGVVYGVLGTALAQAVLAGIGYWIAGIPGALLLGFLSFFLTLIPGGLGLIWIPAAIWLGIQGQKEWAIFMVVWGLLVGAVENVLRPILIKQGSDLPFLLVLLGVIGGAISFGLVGIFLGPTLLALGHGLLQEWGEEQEPGPEFSEPATPV